MPIGSNPPREQLVLLNEELQGRANLQSEELEGLDRKASTMLAGTVVVLGIVVNNVEKFGTSLTGVRGSFLSALVLLAVAMVAGVVALWPRKVKVIPSPGGLVQGYYARDHDETLANLISIRLQALEENKNLAVAKVQALRAQMVLVALGGAGLVAASIAKDWK